MGRKLEKAEMFVEVMCRIRGDCVSYSWELSDPESPRILTTTPHSSPDKLNVLMLNVLEG